MAASMRAQLVISIALLLQTVACTPTLTTRDGEAAPPDAGSSFSAMIGTAGGTVIGDHISLDIPAGALANTVRVEIAATDESLPTGYLAASRIYRFLPEGLRFASPATVRFAYGGDTTQLALLWSNEQGTGFEMLAGTSNAGELAVRVGHFSRGVVIVVPGSVCPGSGDIDCSLLGYCCTASVCRTCPDGGAPDAGAGGDCTAYEGAYTGSAQGTQFCNGVSYMSIAQSFQFSVARSGPQPADGCGVMGPGPAGNTWGGANGSVSGTGAIGWTVVPAGHAGSASFSGTVVLSGATANASGEFTLSGPCGGCEGCSGGGTWTATRP